MEGVNTLPCFPAATSAMETIRNSPFDEEDDSLGENDEEEFEDDGSPVDEDKADAGDTADAAADDAPGDDGGDEKTAEKSQSKKEKHTRKNIRAVLDENDLDAGTRAALEAERERKRRLLEAQQRVSWTQSLG